ncbi:tRNA lysidine(34) synthetase TilS [Enterococcus sp. JM4C]|uniref:tRNA lysidine(34) synthetase TilS n=1 Tax=Candidatus Enterococcus huntleyi TaxID=1857217 RepID=UPI00137A364C|nr:tRNA lysidine(34) synthetase TilS [Enterococcus sp. JM4C]KAF1295264.1 tRNA lysidine(34) synthetase TilS [Enterococcus sp. JM4C]
MENLFFNHGKDKLLWQTKDKILLAISGGVDSMVLLHLMEAVSLKEGLFLAVVHVNHQLREESLAEEAYLTNYCQEKQLPFYSVRWQNAPATGMEEAARTFRYQYFGQVMQQTGCTKLMTAHHGDDQLETLIMKLARGGSLHSHIGIKERQCFAKGELIRPLLPFSKEEIRMFADKQSLVYFEDATNVETHLQRNRIRQQIIPQLKTENARLLPHAQQFSQQLEWAEELISEQMEKEYQARVEKNGKAWIIEESWLAQLPDNKKYYFLSHFFKKRLVDLKVGAKEEQILQLIELLNKGKAQWTIAFSKGWEIKKRYQQISFEKKNQLVEPENVAEQSHTLHYNEGIYLSDHEWLGIINSAELDQVPREVREWETFQTNFPANLADAFVVRHRQAGDRLRLNERQSKKISRYFIDHKVPNEKRASAWVLADSEKNIYGLLPFALSYLSISEETDKILYVLLYKYQR